MQKIKLGGLAPSCMNCNVLITSQIVVNCGIRLLYIVVRQWLELTIYWQECLTYAKAKYNNPFRNFFITFSPSREVGVDAPWPRISNFFVVYIYMIDKVYVLFEETDLFCICLTYVELYPRNMRTTVDIHFGSFIWTVFAHHYIPLCCAYPLIFRSLAE